MKKTIAITPLVRSTALDAKAQIVQVISPRIQLLGVCDDRLLLSSSDGTVHCYKEGRWEAFPLKDQRPVAMAWVAGHPAVAYGKLEVAFASSSYLTKSPLLPKLMAHQGRLIFAEQDRLCSWSVGESAPTVDIQLKKPEVITGFWILGESVYIQSGPNKLVEFTFQNGQKSERVFSETIVDLHLGSNGEAIVVCSNVIENLATKVKMECPKEILTTWVSGRDLMLQFVKDAGVYSALVVDSATMKPGRTLSLNKGYKQFLSLGQSMVGLSFGGDVDLIFADGTVKKVCEKIQSVAFFEGALYGTSGDKLLKFF